jgi:hypothetical protein
MAPTITTQTHTLVLNQEVSYGTIAGGPFDFIDVFVDMTANFGAANLLAEWRVYATVNGVASLVASAQGGGAKPCVVSFSAAKTPDTLGSLEASTALRPRNPAVATGTVYELRAVFTDTARPVPQIVKASIIGYNEFDTVPDATAGGAPIIVPSSFAETDLGIVPGYAQTADISVKQDFTANLIFRLYALAGVGGVEAEVALITLNQPDRVAGGPITRIISPVRLPGATQYRLTVAFDSQVFPPQNPVQVVATLATHSTTIADVDGPFTIVVPLPTTAGLHANVFAAFAALGLRTLTLSGTGGSGGGGGGVGGAAGPGGGAGGAPEFGEATVQVNLASPVDLIVGAGGVGGGGGAGGGGAGVAGADGGTTQFIDVASGNVIASFTGGSGGAGGTLAGGGGAGGANFIGGIRAVTSGSGGNGGAAGVGGQTGNFNSEAFGSPTALWQPGIGGIPSAAGAGGGGGGGAYGPGAVGGDGTAGAGNPGATAAGNGGGGGGGAGGALVANAGGAGGTGGLGEAHAIIQL